MLKVLNLTILFLIVFFNCVSGDGKLRFVAVLFRHGDRTPTKTYPKDPYKNISHYWPDGLGELTNTGIEHQYELGQWFRNRYTGFLREEYHASDIYVRSSDTDRTLMSAAANLAGLYPPKDGQIWNHRLLWRPIPIHTVPNVDDEVVAMKKECRRYDVLFDQLLNSPFFKNINERNKKLYNYLSINTGWNITNVRQIETLFSLLSIEQEYNLTLPSWTEDIFPKKIEFLAALSHGSFSFTKQLARLKNGPFFDYLFTHFDSVISNSTDLKFLIISAHDNTIANILSAMEVYDYTCPKFASSVIWELREIENKFYVNLFYKNGKSVLRLKLYGCEMNCEYNAFKRFLKHVTLNVKDWNEECVV